VGAHQSHLVGGSIRSALQCTDCHVVPAELAHASQPLDLTWGALARTGGTTPAWNATLLTCANYCHGATLAGGSLTVPVWNTVNGTQAACGTCHGLPPASPHPSVSGGVTSCSGCHVGTVNPDGTIKLTGGLHVNGVVEVAGTGGCTGCHGDPARTPTAIAPAPPLDTHGNFTTTAGGVGAHQRHLTGGPVRGPVPCTECHTVPGDLTHASQPLVLTWGPLATARGASASFNPTSLTCANYCHGATLRGGSITAPLWNKVDDTQAACGACHGLPPSSPHPTVPGGLTACAGCHPDTMNANGTLNVAGGKHVDGVIDVSGGHGDYTAPSAHAPRYFDFVSGAAGALQCTVCHGADYGTPVTASGDSCNTCHQKAGWTGWTTNCSFCHGAKSAASQAGYAFATHPTWAAPPDDLNGRLLGSNLAARTGAHQAHLMGTTLSGQSYAQPFACGTCHAVPTDLTHISGSSARAAVSLAGAGQASLPSSLGTYDPASGSCATYCHGSTLSGGTVPAPAWSGALTQCNGCHGIAPDTGRLIDSPDFGFSGSAHTFHTVGITFTCDVCHAATTTWVLQGQRQVNILRTDVSAHVNGGVDVLFIDGGTWDPASGTCAAACHSGATQNWR
jgi:predicted CxxxxCH...CXXCH cytochrome family protein